MMVMVTLKWIRAFGVHENLQKGDEKNDKKPFQTETIPNVEKFKEGKYFCIKY